MTCEAMNDEDIMNDLRNPNGNFMLGWLSSVANQLGEALLERSKVRPLDRYETILIDHLNMARVADGRQALKFVDSNNA